MILLILSLTRTASARGLVPLASGGAPPCSKQNGTREFHSSVAQDDKVSALIIGIARRDATGCHQSVELHVKNGGGTKGFSLPPDADDFEIVDFSPDGSKLFVAEEKSDVVQVASMPISTGELHWQDLSDLLGWNDCDATIEPQGFTADGKMAVRARPSVLSSSSRPNCVSEPHVYALDEHRKAAARADGANIQRYGKKTAPAFQQCQSDPDLNGACFTVHGRLSARNGNPTFRIWPLGTNRIIGISDLPLPPSAPFVLPPSLAGKVNFDTFAFGDFIVCPFTEDKPRSMRMVCIESVRNLTFKHR